MIQKKPVSSALIRLAILNAYRRRTAKQNVSNPDIRLATTEVQTETFDNKPKTLLTGKVSHPKQNESTFTDQVLADNEKERRVAFMRLTPDMERLWEAKSIKEVISILKGFLPFWLSHELLCPNEAKYLMRAIRLSLVDYKAKYNALPSIPIDLLQLKEWIPDAEKVLRKYVLFPKRPSNKKSKKNSSPPLGVGGLKKICTVVRKNCGTISISGKMVEKILTILMKKDYSTKNLIRETKYQGGTVRSALSVLIKTRVITRKDGIIAIAPKYKNLLSNCLIDK